MQSRVYGQHPKKLSSSCLVVNEFSNKNHFKKNPKKIYIHCKKYPSQRYLVAFLLVNRLFSKSTCKYEKKSLDNKLC